MYVLFIHLFYPLILFYKFIYIPLKYIIKFLQREISPDAIKILFL